MLAFIVLTLICTSFSVLGHESFAKKDLDRGVLHKSKPAKRVKYDEYADLNDNDMFEQMDVYSALDEDQFNQSELRPENDAAFTYVVTRKRIEVSGARDLLDILRHVPGLFTSQDVQGFFQVSHRNLRGPGRVMLRLNNQEFSDRYDGQTFWAISASLIERVEINYGPDAVLNGLNQTGAVVSVTTRDKEGFEVGLRSSGQDYASGFGSIGSHYKNFRYSLALNVDYYDNGKLKIPSDRFLNYELDEFAEEGFLKDFKKQVGLVFDCELTLSSNKNSRLLIDTQLFWQDRGGHVGFRDTSGPDSRLSWLIWSFGLAWLHPYGAGHQIEMRFWVNQNSREDFFQLTPHGWIDRAEGNEVSFTKGLVSQTRYGVLKTGLLVKNSFSLFSGNELSISGTVDLSGILSPAFSYKTNREQAVGSSVLLRKPANVAFDQNQPCYLFGVDWKAFDACQLILSAAVEDIWQIDPKLKLLGGIRIFTVSDQSFVFASHFNPKLSIRFMPLPSWLVQFTLEQGVRIPTIKEKTDRTPIVLRDILPSVSKGNPNLKSEVARSAAVTIQFAKKMPTIQHLFQLFGHVTSVSDAIEALSVIEENSLVKNAGGYWIFGLLGSFETYFSKHSFSFLNLSWTSSIWESKDKENLSQIRHFPSLKGSVGGNIHIKDIGDFYVAIELATGRKNSERTLLESERVFSIGPYAMFDISFQTIPFFDFLVVETSVFNLLNFETKDDPPRPDLLPGLIPRGKISWYVGLKLLF